MKFSNQKPITDSLTGMNTHKLNRKAQEIIGTRKQKCFVTELAQARELNTASYWSDGSRDQFVVLNLASGKRTSPPIGQYPMFDAKYTLQPGEVLIRTGVFCGKPATPEITFIACDKTQVATMFELPLVSPTAKP